MPAIVDHIARRKEVTVIAARLIARQGIAGMSFREIAREAGYSTAIVSHYFHDKAELMVATYRHAMAQVIEQARRRRARGGSLQQCLEAMMPLDRRRRDNWKVWIAFWGLSVADEAFRAEQQRGGRAARAFFAELIASESGLDIAERRDDQVRRLAVVIAGLATQATHDPADWPRVRQRALLAGEIEALGLVIHTPASARKDHG